MDVATGISKAFEMDAICELLIKHGGQTILQSQRRNKSEPESSFLTSDELQTTSISLQTITNMTLLEDTNYIIKRKSIQSEISSFTSFINSST